MYIEYSTYQLSGESKKEYRKKRDPERVKSSQSWNIFRAMGVEDEWYFIHKEDFLLVLNNFSINMPEISQYLV